MFPTTEEAVVAIKLAQEVNGQKPGATYSGPAAMLPWLKEMGYVYDDAAPVSHLKSPGGVPLKDDPTLNVNREAPNGPDYSGYVDAIGTSGDGPEVVLGGHKATITATSITPATGPAVGGTVVTIKGNGLIDVTGITFGGTAATNIVVQSDDSIKCTAPVHAAGAVNVVLTDADGSTTKTAFYTYT